MENYSLATGAPGSPGQVGGVPGAGSQRAEVIPARVLVVDDEPSLAELLSSVLRYEGWHLKRPVRKDTRQSCTCRSARARRRTRGPCRPC